MIETSLICLFSNRNIHNSSDWYFIFNLFTLIYQTTNSHLEDYFFFLDDKWVRLELFQ